MKWITWLNDQFEANTPENSEEKSPGSDKIKQSSEAKSKDDRQTEDSELEMIKSLKIELTKELSNGIKALRFHTKQRLSKQTKRVRACLRQLSHPGEDTPDGHLQGKEYSQPAIDSDSDTDSDSDVDEDEQLKVRYERVSYDESKPSNISYEDNNGKVGSCQFLNQPMSTTLKYFEVKVVDYGRTGSIGIGLAHRSYPLHRMPGLSKGSIAYHCDNGRIFYGQGRGIGIASPAQQGDTIGCGIKCYNGIEDTPIVFFTRNGEELGSKRVKLPKSGFFPIVGLRSQGEEVEVNLDAEWKSPQNVGLGGIRNENGRETSTGVHPEVAMVRYSEDAMQRTSDGQIFPDSLHDEVTRSQGRVCPTVDSVCTDERSESESAFDAPRRTSDGQTSHPYRSARVFAEGNFLRYNDELGRVGVYQSRLRMSNEFSYYEVTVKDHGTNGTIAVGLARQDYPLNQQPGWQKGSIAWHCDDAGLYIEHGFPCAVLDTPPKIGDTVGCGIGKWSRSEGEEGHVNQVEVYFTHNGYRIDEVTIDEPEGGLFPTVGMHSPGEMVEINFTADSSTVQQKPRTERVKIEEDRVSFVPNRYDDVGGIQLMCKSMAELDYFEVKILSGGEQGTIGIGIAVAEYPLDCQPGWGEGSIAYHCDDGLIFKNGDIDNELESKYPSSSRNIIGCRIRDKNDQQKLEVYFTRNGQEIHQTFFEGWQSTDLYPTVCMQSQGEMVKINTDARWDKNPERLFSRWERIEIDGKKASYVPGDYTGAGVGAVQLSREINKDYPYFEIEITCFGEEGSIGIGLAPRNYQLDMEPGWLPDSVGYHCDDGCLFEGVSWKGKKIHPSGRQGDRIGCGVENPEDKGGKVIVFFTHNGEKIDHKAELKRPGREGLFPTIGMASIGEAITVIEGAKWLKSESRAIESNGNKNDIPMKLRS